MTVIVLRGLGMGEDEGKTESHSSICVSDVSPERRFGH